MKYTGTLSITSFDLNRSGRLMALIPLCKYSTFIKYFDFSTGTSLLTGLKSLCCAVSRIMAVDCTQQKRSHCLWTLMAVAEGDVSQVLTLRKALSLCDEHLQAGQ